MSAARRGTAALAAGSVANGLLAYLLFALLTRGLGAEVAAPVSVLWTYWALAAAALTFPLQHWITRSVVSGSEGEVRRAAGRVTGVVLASALGAGLVAWLLGPRLFHRDDVWFPVLVALVTVGSAAMGVVRGGLAGHRRFVAVAWTLVAENLLRCLLVAGLLLAGVQDPVVHGLALAAGALIALWPAAWRFDGAGAGGAGVLTFLGGAAVGQLVAQVVLTGGPLLLALLGGSPAEVTALFAAFALFRAPYLVVLGTLPQLTQRVTAHVVSGRVDQLRSLTRGLAAVTVVAVPSAAAFGALLGPWLLRLVFGDSVQVSSTTAAVVAAGCTLAVANVVLVVTALARDRPIAVTLAWGVAIVAGALVAVLPSATEPVTRTCAAFLVAEVVAAAALAVVVRRSLRPRVPSPA